MKTEPHKLTAAEKIALSRSLLDDIRQKSTEYAPPCSKCAWGKWHPRANTSGAYLVCTQPLVANSRYDARKGTVVQDWIMAESERARAKGGVCGLKGDLFADPPPLTTRDVARKFLRITWQTAVVGLYLPGTALVTLLAYQNFELPVAFTAALFSGVGLMLILRSFRG